MSVSWHEMSDLSIKVGERIKNARMKAGVSQEELGFRSGLHRTYISMAERGSRNLTVRSLVAIARALNVKPSELLEGIG